MDTISKALSEISTDEESEDDLCLEESPCIALSSQSDGASSNPENPPQLPTNIKEAFVQPYMYMPLRRNQTEHTVLDHEWIPDLAHFFGPMTRLLGNHWCTCGHCSPMDGVANSVCCHEIPQLDALRKTEDVACMTLHPGFSSCCLDPWVLRAAYHSYRSHHGEMRDHTQHERYRHTAYRNLVHLAWGYLGKNNRVQLPACTVTRIREEFPSVQYTGHALPPMPFIK